MSDDEPQIKVFASDDNLKSLGELLSNDTSRQIIYNLMTKEMYTNEISTKLDMRVSLVIHHLKKMEELNMLTITNKKIKRKGVEHRFFRINFDIFVTLDKSKEDIKEQGFLSRIFKDTIKFTTIAIAGISSYFLYFKSEILDPNMDKDLSISNPIVNNHYESLVISLIVSMIGISALYLSEKKKNRGY